MARGRAAAAQEFEVVVEQLPLNDDGWRALEKRVQARLPVLRAQFLAGFDRYGRLQVPPGPRRGLRLSVPAGSRREAGAEARRRLEGALTGWKELQFYDPASVLASARITVLPKPKYATQSAGGESPERRPGN